MEVTVVDENNQKTEISTGKSTINTDSKYYESSIERSNIEEKEKEKEEKEKIEKKETETSENQSESESESESEEEKEKEKQKNTQNNFNTKKDGNSGDSVEDNSDMVYSRIHGYRIRVTDKNDSKSFYKKILGGLREVKN